MSGLFISYRRQDAAGYAGRLRDALARRYGDERVFLDVADLAPGSDFQTQLHEKVAACESMLVVIGPQWLTAADPSGRRRLDDPHDFIRHEVAAALRQGKRVVPVLVDHAMMPPREDLPPDIAALGRRQACQLRHESWDHDLDQLLGVLDPLMGHASGGRTTEALPAPQPGLPFLVRLSQAWDVLLGRVAQPSQAPMPASTAALAPHEVFISYASEDEVFADKLVRSLESQGRRCWIAHRDIPPGVPSWAEPIVAAIAGSRAAVVLLTEHSIASDDVLREVTLAGDEKIPLLGVSLDSTPLSPGLRYFFAAGQRLHLAGSKPADQLVQIGPAVERLFPAKGT